MRSLNIKYLSRLDHLRFIACFLVILVHSKSTIGFKKTLSVYEILKLWVENASLGVSIFLCITGFLFCLITNCGKKEIDYGKFIYNRILRIFPLTMFIFFSIITLSRVTSTPMDILRVLTLQFNTGDFFKWVSEYFHAGAIWTIAVEFQFYLIFPFISLFLGKMGVRYLLGLILVILFFKFNLAGIGIFHKYNPFNDLYFSILGRLDQFIVGMIFACLYKKGKTRFLENWVYGILSFLLSFSILTILFMFKPPVFSSNSAIFNSLFLTFYFLIEAIACCLFIVIYLEIQFFKLKSLNRAFSFLGSISFSIYLLHGFVIEIVRQIFGLLIKKGFIDTSSALCEYSSYIIIFPCVLLGVIGVSCLTYYVIEKPFMSLRTKYLKS